MSIEIIKMNDYEKLSSLTIHANAIFFHGNENIDNRSTKVFKYLSSSIEDTFKIIYDESKFTIKVSKNDIDLDIFTPIEFGVNFIKNISCEYLYLDATSLGFAELLLTLHNIQKFFTAVIIKVLYAEPKEYTLKKEIGFEDEFDLTSSFNDFQKIPPYSLLIDSNSNEKAHIIPFLGFENDRLGRIIENDEGARYSLYTPILAIPAFVAGWENISLRHHYQELEEIDNIEFSPANNPYETYQILKKIQRNSDYKKIVLAPIGTKPHAIGGMIFLINSKIEGLSVGIVYDFPIKKEKRTDGIGKIHEYTLGIR